MNTKAKENMRLKNKALYRSGKKSLTVLAGSTLLGDPRKVTVTTKSGKKDIKGYSIVLLAKALGKSVIQVRSWIDKKIIPEPILLVKSYNYYVYDTREAQIIRKHLYAQTKKDTSYLTKNSIDFVDRLSTEIWEYRGEKYAESKKTKKRRRRRS